MPRVLITGGAGFIGSHVVELFLDQGWSVTVVDDLSSGKRSNVPAAATFVEASIESEPVAREIADTDIDAVVHLAAQVDVRRSVADPLFDASTNVLGTIALLRAAVERERAPRFVFASSGGAIYGAVNPPPYDEKTPPNPDAPYGIAKLAAEHYVTTLGRLHDMEVVNLRFANVYGPRQDPAGEAGVVAIFCDRLLAGQPLTVFGSGGQTRDYVYVGDVARAVFAATGQPMTPGKLVEDRAYNVGTSRETSVLELIDALARVSGLSPSVLHAAARKGEAERSALDCAKMTRDFGWTASTGLEAGLATTYGWFKQAAKAA